MYDRKSQELGHVIPFRPIADGADVGLELNLGKWKLSLYGGDLESRAAATDAMRHFESTLKFPTPAELDLLACTTTLSRHRSRN
ncbi:hypothetical protein BV898_19495 [Hypsibius exemplaris]|uniref:Uncharacterized protein n=1 Tax=Hypsibius exemplaris TaxID=2072580 RepID=A0A9X6NLR2_HYPEX|nr:hypothetical protein BV898_19495 [Hypsibius exemplaris]